MADQAALAIAAGGGIGVVLGVILLFAWHPRLILVSLALGCLLGAGAMAVPVEQTNAANTTIIDKTVARVPPPVIALPPAEAVKRRWHPHPRRPVLSAKPMQTAAPYLLWWMNK